MTGKTPVSVECGAMVEEKREAPTPSGFVKTRVQCRGRAVGDVTDRELVCNQCGTTKPNPHYQPSTEPIHVKKNVEY